ncbi:DNA-methyltransferase [Robertmurraya siralis]|uniref:DNA-methyltransferase n=1 Tax=Robertmurraya siralis TaxID=77777 RepID=UPI0010F44413|nr:DNA methyltransferase [Robertmurraya siralis]
MSKELLGELELNRIYQRDVIEGLKMIPDNSATLVIADPPYYKIVKENWDNQWESESEYYEWCRQWIRESKRILKQDGALYIWNWFDNICSLGHIAKAEGFTIRNLITWNRGGGRERNNWCSKKEELLYLTLSDTPLFNLEEVLLPADHPARKMSKQAWERGRYERKGRKNYNEEAVNPSNVWYDSLVASNSKEKVNHPTQKPLSICERIVLASSNAEDLVVIPFCGSGSECVASLKNNRKFISFELEHEYIEIANMRLDSIELN